MTTDTLDSIDATLEHADLIKAKRFLRGFYDETYSFFQHELETCPAGDRLELGSGAGYIKDVIPDVVTSDVIELPGVDKVVDATSLPFKASSLSAIMMIDVFHHIQNVESFLKECERTLKPGAKLIMLEPANTLFARLFYQNFHHEPFDPKRESWRLPEGGRLTMANGALPWIVFQRDIKRFEEEFPTLSLSSYNNCYPLQYLLSGGLSWPQFLPDFCYPLVLGVEKLLSPINPLVGMFCRIVITKSRS